ncbi:unnamed protein product, partial [Closterium sp. NIES-54]
IFQEQILARADVGPSGDEAVVEFEGVHVLTPRGRFKVELHVSHVRLQGMAVDFKIQYKNLARLFVLPKVRTPLRAAQDVSLWGAVCHCQKCFAVQQQPRWCHGTAGGQHCMLQPWCLRGRAAC